MGAGTPTQAWEDTLAFTLVLLLMYDSIGTGATRKFRQFAVSPEKLTAQMDYLQAAGSRAGRSGVLPSPPAR